MKKGRESLSKKGDKTRDLGRTHLDKAWLVAKYKSRDREGGSFK